MLSVTFAKIGKNETLEYYIPILRLWRLLRTGEAAKRLGVTTKTLRRWIETGIIKAHRIRKEYRIPETEVMRGFEREKT